MLRQLLIAAASLSLAVPAFALNPQPLPPGFRAPFAPRNAIVPHTIQRPGGWGRPLPICHGVQVGDPRKQPPMRVCN